MNKIWIQHRCNVEKYNVDALHFPWKKMLSAMCEAIIRTLAYTPFFCKAFLCFKSKSQFCQANILLYLIANIENLGRNHTKQNRCK